MSIRLATSLGFWLGACACLLAAPAAAHHPGGDGNTGGAGPINTIPAGTLAEGQIAAAVRYEFIRLGGLGDADLIAAAARHEHVHTIRTIESASLSVAGGLTDDITIGIRFPYVSRTDIREGHHQHLGGGAVLNTVDARGNAAGFGDVTLFGQWRFYNNPLSGTEAALLAGVKAPSGRTGRFDSAGELFEAEFQPGSGSWDGLFGMALTQRFGSWSLDGNVLWVMVNKGTQDTDLGDRFLYNAAVSYRAIGARPGALQMHAGHVHTKKHTNKDDHEHAPAQPGINLDLVFELNGEWHDKEAVAGVRDPNSGGHTLYAAPGLRVSYDRYSGYVSVGVPVVNDVNGVQSKPDYRIVTGIGARLN